MDDKDKVLQLIDRFMVDGDAGVARRFVADNVISHSALPGQSPGVTGLIDTFAMFRKAFSGFSIQVHQLLAAGDKVVSHVTVRGTHTGPFMGTHPSGKPISYEEITIFRFKDGQIVEHWAVADTGSMMQQMGMIPP